MKTELTISYWPVRWLLIGLAGFLVLLVILPPFISPEWRLAVYQALSPICHQLPERSFHIHAIPLGVCFRCTGIIAGFLVALSVPWRGLQTWKVYTILLVAVTPVVVDWLLGFLGIWDSWVTALLTGVWMGSVFAGAVVGIMDKGQQKTDNDFPTIREQV